MQSILIIEPSDYLRTELEKELQKDHQIFSCSRGDEGLLLISMHHPDGLILNLMLPGIDGLMLLETVGSPLPKVIITLSAIYPPPVLQKLLDLGISYAILIGCPVHTIAHHIRSFMKSDIAAPLSAQDIVSQHLCKLNVPYWRGYDDLRVGVPLFAQDPDQSMTKDLYPAIAALRGRDNWKQVEKAIRDVKEYAYKQRDNKVWKEYFTNTARCPTNRDFISRLSEFLK